MNKDNSILKSYLVILGVCLVASFFVSVAAVKLSPIQRKNQHLEKIKTILIVADLYNDEADIEEIYKDKVEKRWVNLKTGDFLTKNVTLDLEKSNIDSLAKSEKFGEEISSSIDVARIKRRPKFMPVYFVRKNNKIDRIILPVYGKGLWSTLYGFIALESNIKTIAGITFYEQGETPGLGAEITNPKWQKQWKGKQAFNDQRDKFVTVIKGAISSNSLENIYQVNGIAGATLTSQGVNNLVHYWLSDHGYGVFLTKLMREGHG